MRAAAAAAVVVVVVARARGAGARRTPELTSRLFAEHYHAPLNEAIYGSADRIATLVDAG
jgi:hypothetical protein